MCSIMNFPLSTLICRVSQALRLGGGFPHVCPQCGQRYATPYLCVCGLVSQWVDAGLPKAARATAIVRIAIKLVFIVFVLVLLYCLMFGVEALPLDFKALIGEPQFDKEIGDGEKENRRDNLYCCLLPLLP